jgi:hypothetical protein
MASIASKNRRRSSALVSSCGVRDGPLAVLDDPALVVQRQVAGHAAAAGCWMSW